MNVWMPEETRTAAQVKAAEIDLKAGQVVRRLVDGWVQGKVRLPSEEELAAA